MTIMKKDDYDDDLVIDLTGPAGNAFYLMGSATDLAKQLGFDYNAIVEEMQAGDYDNLVAVYDKYFGAYVTLLR